MRFKTKKWASPFFIISLAVAGIFGVAAAMINNQTEEAPVVEKAEAAYTLKWWADKGTTSGTFTHLGCDLYVLKNVSIPDGTQFNIYGGASTYKYGNTNYCVTPGGGWGDYGQGNLYHWTGNYTVDFYVSTYNSGNSAHLFIVNSGSKNKIISFKIASNLGWEPTHIYPFRNGSDGVTWPGYAVSTDGYSYYAEVPEFFNAYVANDNNGNHKTVDSVGSTSGNEVWHILTSKTSGNYNTTTTDPSHESGRYLLGTGINGSTGDFVIEEAVASSGSTTGVNAAIFENVVLSAGAVWKIGWYDKSVSKVTAWYNGPFAGQHINHSWGSPHQSNNVVCSTAGTYKIYLGDNSADDQQKTISVNMDFRINYYEVKDGSTSAQKYTTGNSDVYLSTTLSGKFGSYTGYVITGYYTNEACTTPVVVGNPTSLDAYPTSIKNIYAKYELKYSVISNLNVRFWVGYDTSWPFYKDGVTIKLWIHDGNNQDYTNYNEVFDNCVTIYNSNDSNRRYDYFDIPVSCVTNGYYVSFQRFYSGGYGTYQNVELTSDYSGLIYYIYSDWNDGAFSTTIDNEADSEMAVAALCSYHTCSTSDVNGTGKAFANYEDTFVDDDASKLSNYYINDFENGDTSYAKGATVKTNAYSKYLGLQSEAAGLGAISSFKPFNLIKSEENISVFIVIIASSISLLSVTALSVLLVKKKKRVNQ